MQCVRRSPWRWPAWPRRRHGCTNTGNRKGRYRVNGYLVDLHFDDGEKVTLPVMVYPGGKTLRVGAKEYVRQ